ncbi:hypothetical protein M5K25_023277 [Dendrobium thyrsiflorum]|uniref:VQ domain-containing protein n=1 Tax=Dendrobium thyrsiflorum TaxID=117978 RepID=A0ABD0U7R8_DENTH
MNDGDADPVDWSQFYKDMASGRRDRPRQSHANATSVIGDSTTELTMPISIDVAAASGSRGKPAARKRSRTSRRAPTTLLNTDTSNFRAMVQQFTGAPSVPYTTSYMPAGATTTTLNFGIGFNNPASQSTILPSFGVLETRQNQYQYQQEALAERYINLPQHSQYRHPPQQQEMIGFGIGENIEDDRHQVLESSKEVGLGLPEEFFLDGIGGGGGGQVNPRQTSENNRGGGYFL